MSEGRKTTALVILDGWGHKEPASDNAISNAQTPFWDSLWATRPKTLIKTSGMAVGLPEGQMGNSEVGHMNLGAGRIVYQNFTRITKAIDDGEFQTNPALTAAIDKAVANGKAIHLLGLLSPGGVHSHEDHLHAAAELAAKRGAKRVYVHAFLDGRDTPPRSAEPSIAKMEAKLAELGVGRVASIVGRYFAMDRDNRWDRIESAYNLLTQAEAHYTAATGVDGLKAAYERNEDDEFVKPTRVQGTTDPNAVIESATIEDGDAVLFMNFRADRAREITRAFVEGDEFKGFVRSKQPKLADFVTLTEYAADIPATCAYPPGSLENDLGAYLAGLGKTQLRIAETEKYAHVTFFFSGGREAVYDGEERILVPSPNVATYDLQPEMSAPEMTDKLVAAIESGNFDLIVCNYANGDMVGHTGNLEAAMKAAQCIDACLRRIDAALEKSGGQALITADHGNCEQMADSSTGQAHTAHTSGPVPLVYLGKGKVSFRDGGRLSDVAPTLLTLMHLEKPAEMTGNSLVATV